MSDSNSQDELYGAYYYANCCGQPYRRDDPHWLRFFGSVAERIISDIAPKTVFDAGCALGFLVESLRQRGVAAYGADISSYAIANASPAVQPYLWVGSLTDAAAFLPPDADFQKYDLIVCIEVLEHLSKPESEQALRNLCQYADDILFSSSPLDQREATHFNVQPPEYWAEQFARHGFYRDPEADFSLLTPWAARFRRSNEPFSRLVRGYERRIWQALKESSDLRQGALQDQHEIALRDARLVDYANTVADREARLAEREAIIASQQGKIEEQQREFAALHSQIAYQDQAVQTLQHELAAVQTQNQSLQQQVLGWQARWADLERGRLWRAMQQIRALRLRLLPPGSRQEALARSLWSGLARLRAGRPAAAPAANPAEDYQRWMAEFEAPAAAGRTEIASGAALPRTDTTAQQSLPTAYSLLPTVSFITPVYNPPPEILQATLESLLAQTAGNWELCLADASDAPAIRPLLESYATRDARIRVQFLAENGGISANSNRAIEMAGGEYVAILDHDDVLAPQMLAEVNQAIAAAQPDLIYFDEDKLSYDGRSRHDPFFKPDWSPEMLLSANYLTHCVIRRSLLLEVGCFDPQSDGAQDWDLAFRLTERTQRVYHIPKILYHWRQIPGSTAANLQAKSWAFERQLRCVENHLKRLGVEQASASFPEPGYLRVTWPIVIASESQQSQPGHIVAPLQGAAGPQSGRAEIASVAPLLRNDNAATDPLVSIIIPSKDRFEYIFPCLTSLFGQTAWLDYEVLLVDNGSSDPRVLEYYAGLARDPRFRLLHDPRPFNFQSINNLGAAEARGQVLVFLNNDTQVISPDWLEELLRWALRPQIGVVGAKLLFPDQTIQHAGVVMGMRGHADHIFRGLPEKSSGPFGSVEWYRNYQAVTAACMALRRSTFEEVGGFDEVYQVAFGDIDLCLRVAERGYRNLYTPYARLLHHEGKSRVGSVPAADILRACDQMQARIAAGDPYFNPNLSYTERVPSLQRRGEEELGPRIQRIRAEVAAMPDGTIYKLH